MRPFAALLAMLLFTAACVDGVTASTTTQSSPVAVDLDADGDGRILIGVATNGPRDDGAYYQALVDGMVAVALDHGWADPIVVDLIDPANAEAELRAIAGQGADVIVVGASAIAEPLPALLAEFPDVFWYCNCGSNYPRTDGLLISRDRGAELWLSGGYAAGLLLAARGADRAVFLGCCDLEFERESFLAFQRGLELAAEATAAPGLTAIYVPTGNFPFDFNNTPGAIEALTVASAEGADAVAPFLGGAHDPVLALANGSGLLAIAAGNSDACNRTDVVADLMVKYDSGDYVRVIFDEILAGTAREGGIREFHVGVDPEVGAELCSQHGGLAPQLAEFTARIGSGEFATLIDQILGEAYGSS